MRFAVPFSFRRCGDGRGGGRDWGRGALFFLSPSVVDEGSESEQARRAREREREREAPEGRCTSNQTATRPQVSMTQSTRTTRRWGTERRRKRAGTPPLWRSRYGRTDGPSCSRRRASPFLRLTRDSSHHLPSTLFFFSSSSCPGSARFHQEGFQHPRRPAARDLLVRHRVCLQRAAQGLRFPEHVARLRRLPSHLW